MGDGVNKGAIDKWKGEPDAFINSNRQLIDQTGLSDDDVRTLFRARDLCTRFDQARANVEKALAPKTPKPNKNDPKDWDAKAQKGKGAWTKQGKEKLAARRAARPKFVKEAAAKFEGDRIGLDADLTSYISTKIWAENLKAWQRKAVNALPNQVGARIKFVSESVPATHPQAVISRPHLPTARGSSTTYTVSWGPAHLHGGADQAVVRSAERVRYGGKEARYFAEVHG